MSNKHLDLSKRFYMMPAIMKRSAFNFYAIFYIIYTNNERINNRNSTYGKRGNPKNVRISISVQ
jgi:hypothetical protein